MQTQLTTWTGIAAVALLSLAATGCTGDGSPVAPTATVALTADVATALERGIQDEYKAETTYQGVVDDLGPQLPFANILTAEERHSDAIASLYTRRGLPVPTSDWTAANVPHFDAVPAACGAAAQAEVDNIAMYDDLLRLDLPDDVRQVFENNRRASLVNHLPAFGNCS